MASKRTKNRARDAKLRLAAVACFSMSAALASDGIDVSDIDDDLMRGMDDAIKDLEPVLGAGNGESAIADGEVLRDGLQWTEDYFTARGSPADAVRITRQGRDLVAQILKSIEDKDFETAIDAARKTAKNCRSCHDIYKP